MSWLETLPEQAVFGETMTAVPLNVHSQALTNSIFVKSGQGALVGFTAYSNKASSQFIQVFNLTALPADGAIPDAVFIVQATNNLSVQWVPWRFFHVGCVICNSSTAATKTIGSADTFFDVQYI